MTQAIMSTAFQNNIGNNADGRVKVNLTTSTSAGYTNLQCEQYNDWGHYSVPINGQIVNVEKQSMTNVIVTGYNNQIIDPNFITTAGSSTNYSASINNNIVTYYWYQIRDANGVWIQKGHTNNKENEMMGQTTNHILLDMANLLIQIITYLQNNETIFNTHIHTGGTAPNGNTGTSTITFTPPPSDTNVQNDIPRLNNNENLAGNNYSPY